MKKTPTTLNRPANPDLHMQDRLKTGKLQRQLKTSIKLCLKMLLTATVFILWSTSLSAQCAMACNDHIQLSINGNCQAIITYDMILEDGDNPFVCNPNGPQAFKVIIDYPSGTNTYDPPDQIDETHIGFTLNVTIMHWYSGNSCWGTISVEDKLGPNMTCPPNTTVSCNETINPSNTGIPVITDCVDFSWSHQDVVTEQSCPNPVAATILRTFTATDSFGNTRTCTQTITIERSTLADITPPVNYDGTSSPDMPALPCGASTDPASLPGPNATPTINGGLVAPGLYCSLATTYTDQIIDLCGNSYKIIRTWTVADWCSGAIQTFIQFIKVADSLPPQIICPQDLTVGTASYTCNANIMLPQAQVSDACSNVSIVIQSPLGTINGNGGMLPNVPVGDHTLTYIATDECGNISSCTMQLTIVDQSPPVAVCDVHTAVSLQNTDNGQTQICATVFDDGSYDNCSPVDFTVREMNGPATFMECIFLDCDDINASPVMVVVRVTDASGNYSECMVEVEVQDKTDPVLLCPPTATLDCGQDPLDLNLTGEASGSDNCSINITSEILTNNINNCGAGQVQRRWVAQDGSGNNTACIQLIEVVNSDPFDITDIAWPPDTPPFNTCTDINDLSPDNLDAPYDGPVLNESICDLVAMNYTDQVFNIAPPACYKILRTWVIVDWCQYDIDSNDDTGIWEYVQEIKVLDSEAPVLSIPADIDWDSTEDGCTTSFVTVPLATATDCNPNATITNDSPYAVSNGANATGNYPFGTTVVTYTATDGCGNISSDQIEIKVDDGKKPTPYCLGGLTIELMQTGMVTVWATDFNQGSFDNCTSQENLEFRIQFPSAGVGQLNPPPASATSVTFDCFDLGTQQVDVWVGDENGNWDYCITFLIIQDNMNVCPGPESASISGTIATESAEVIPGVTVQISGNVSDPVSSGEDGSYLFWNIPLEQNYVITPSLQSAALNGVSTLDMVLMLQHILGVQTLDSPYKLIAADVNNSGSITTADMLELRKLILHIYTEFPNNDSWRFIDASYVFPEPLDPFANAFPELAFINELTDDQQSNFIGVKVGDLDGNAIAQNILQDGVGRNGEAPLLLTAENKQLESGILYTIPIKVHHFKKLLGYQFMLHFDTGKLAFEGLESGTLEGLSKDNFALNRIDQGMITSCWGSAKPLDLAENEILFRIRFRAKTSIALDKVLGIDSKLIRAEAYRQTESEVERTADLLDVQLLFEEERLNTTSIAEVVLYQNYPNPFKERTVIAFYLNEKTGYSLGLYDMTGKWVNRIEGVGEKGYNTIQVNKEDLKGTGVFFYELKTDGVKKVRKMIAID